MLIFDAIIFINFYPAELHFAPKGGKCSCRFYISGPPREAVNVAHNALLHLRIYRPNID
jgi:hypothetical protein